jgi:hypothetical protein
VSTAEAATIGTVEKRLPPDWRPEFVESLSKARPLAIFLGISFLSAGGLVLFAGAGMFMFSRDAPIAGLMQMLGALYVVMGPGMAVPALFLFRYSTAAKRYRDVQGPTYLKEALLEHARFWMYVGLVTVISVIVELGVLAALIFGVRA